MNIFTKDLSYGSIGSQVFYLQGALQKLGYGKFQRPVPYMFGPATRQAVIDFQKANGITPAQGYFGPLTRAKLHERLSDYDREKIYSTAVSFLGKDASPNDLANDEYGCADSVCGVLFKALGYPGFEWTVSTTTLYTSLINSPDWMEVDASHVKRGDVIVSPTGMSSIVGTPISNGHTGVVGDNSTIMSNNSYKGVFESNYTFKTWEDRYVKKGGYKMHFFRKV